MKTKVCSKCRKEKPCDEFYENNVHRCKECIRSAVKANRLARIEYYRSFDKARASTPQRVKARVAYAKTPKGLVVHSKAKKKWTERNKEKRNAADVVNNAVRDGKLKKSCACENCGKSNCRIEGHHNDYSKPLEVRWLCSSCHRKWHEMYGPVGLKEGI